jgi:hypothetical protein
MTTLRFAIVLEVVSDKPRKPGLIIAAARVIRDCLISWFL